MAYTPIYTSTTAVYNKSGLSATEIDLSTKDDLIQDAELELEVLTGKKWTSGVAKTEFFNTTGKDILGYTGQNTVSVNLSCYPIQSITEFKTLDIDGNATNTFATLTSTQIVTNGLYYTTDYWLESMNDPISGSVVPYGKITLKDTNFTAGTQNVKCAYTYGYSSVPVMIRDLASCLAGIRAWTAFLGGQYNRLDSYNIPQQGVGKGNFYDRGQKMIDLLKEEADRILDRIGKKSKTIYATGGVR